MCRHLKLGSRIKLIRPYDTVAKICSVLGELIAKTCCGVRLAGASAKSTNTTPTRTLPSAFIRSVDRGNPRPPRDEGLLGSWQSTFGVVSCAMTSSGALGLRALHAITAHTIP